MSADELLTPEDLAARLRIDVDEVLVLRKRRNWPHVRLGRFNLRFTEEQARQIIAAHTVSGTTPQAPKGGLTERSARRSA